MAVTDTRVARAVRAPARSLESFGRQLSFHVSAYAWGFRAVRRYRREIVRLLGEVALGTGALAMVGGTVVVVIVLTGAAGFEVGQQGYKQLNDIGVQALAGFISSYVNTRTVAPLIAAIGLVATVGGGFTAQIGAMRVSEEIDALEVMAVPSVPFLVTTRILAGVVAVVPLYCVALVMSYGATNAVVTIVNRQPTGTYDHYFQTFLIPSDLVVSFVKVIVMALVIMSVHCYYGFTASGGPVGVGQSVGRAVRLSLICVMFTDLLMSMALYGPAKTLHISG